MTRQYMHLASQIILLVVLTAILSVPQQVRASDCEQTGQLSIEHLWQSLHDLVGSYADHCYSLADNLSSDVQGRDGDPDEYYEEFMPLGRSQPKGFALPVQHEHLLAAMALISKANREPAPELYDQAAAEAEAALELVPDWPEACYTLAVARAGQGKLKSAIREYEIYLQLTPGDPYNNHELVQQHIDELTNLWIAHLENLLHDLAQQYMVHADCLRKQAVERLDHPGRREW